MSAQDQNTANQTVAPFLDDRNATHSISDTLAAEGQFTQLLNLFRQEGLEGTLDFPDLVTLFAPSDEALNKTPLTGSPEQLHHTLRHHLVQAAPSGADLRTGKELKTMAGTKLPIRIEGSDVFIGEARIVRFDISCTNGMIHVIDRPLIPPAE